MSRLKTAAACAAAALLFGGVAASTVFSVMAYSESKSASEAAKNSDSINPGQESSVTDIEALSEKVAAGVFQKLKNFEENGFGKQTDSEGHILIAGEYPIIDYHYIAEAYANGDDSDLSDKDKAVYKAMSEIINEIWTDDMSLYEKELAAHDWLAANVSFDDGSLSAIPTASEDAASPYGALVQKKCVCVGYATTFQLLMYAAGAEDCQVVHDTDYGHSWNIVKLDDGEYYFVDVYSDADDGVASHSAFNVSSERLSESHDWDQSAYPEASGTKYNYAVASAVEIATVYDLPQEVYDFLEENKKVAAPELYFTIPDKETCAAGLYTLQEIESRIGMDSYELVGSDDYYFDYDVIYENNTLYYYFAVIKLDADDSPDIPVPDDIEDNTDYDKLDKKLSDIFGNGGWDFGGLF